MNICQISVCLKERNESLIVNTAYNGKTRRARRGLESKTSSVESYLSKNRSKELLDKNKKERNIIGLSSRIREAEFPFWYDVMPSHWIIRS